MIGDPRGIGGAIGDGAAGLRVEPAYPGRVYVTSRSPRSAPASTYGRNGRPVDGVPWCATRTTPSSGPATRTSSERPPPTSSENSVTFMTP